MASYDDLHLFRGQIRPRMCSIIVHWAPPSAILSGVVATIFAPGLPFGALRIEDVANSGLTFATISVGACFTALVLALGLPGEKRLRSWARARVGTSGRTLLSDLVFVLLWAGLAQIALILACGAAIYLGGTRPVALPGMSFHHGLGLAIALSCFFYALIELVIVLQTLVQVGVLIIAEELVPGPEAGAAGDRVSPDLDDPGGDAEESASGPEAAAAAHQVPPDLTPPGAG